MKWALYEITKKKKKKKILWEIMNTETDYISLTIYHGAYFAIAV
jgi:hypothetical protein